MENTITAAAGTQAAENLPHAHPCGVRWAGLRTAHCGACHETFVGVTAFDRHRDGGACADPLTLGMVHAPGRAYPAWTVTVPVPAPCGRGSITCSQPDNCLSCYPREREIGGS